MPDPSNTDPFDTASEPGVSRPPESEQHLDRRYVTAVVSAISVIALTAVAFIVPVPYVTMRPGPVFDTLGDFDGQRMLEVDPSVTTYPVSGSLDFTTVSVTSVSSEVTFVEAIEGYFDDDVNVVPRSLIYPEGTTADQSREASAAQLSSSKDSSRVAALRAAGYTVPEAVVVASVDPEGAGADVLEADDVILAVNGQPVAAPSEAVELISSLTPGDDVTLSIRRGDQTSDVTVTTRPADDDPEVPRVGVGLGSTFTFPFEITNNVGDSIGGPSAGSMFALAIYDLLTPGELTGGLRVAGTGEIDADGTVGSIGGVRQKMAGAAEDDVEVFLVPAENCSEAATGTDFGMTLVEIGTLQDAIDALETLADDPDAEVPTCE